MGTIPAAVAAGILFSVAHFSILSENQQTGQPNDAVCLVMYMLTGFLQSLSAIDSDLPAACTTCIGRMAYFTYNNLVLGFASYGTRLWKHSYSPGMLHLVRMSSVVTAIMYILCVLPYEDFDIINIVSHLLPMITTFIIDKHAVSERDFNILAAYSLYYYIIVCSVKIVRGSYPYKFLGEMKMVKLLFVGIMIVFTFDTMIGFYL